MKRAWEITTAAKEAAVPHLKPEAVRGPAFVEQPTPEQAIRKQISDPVADSDGPQLQLFGAIQAVGNRGRDVRAAEALIPAVWQAYEAEDDVELAKLVAQTYALLEQAPKDPQSPYWSYPEYRDFEDLLAEVAFPEKTPLSLSDDELLERLHAGWQGQIAGAAVGTMVEGYCTPQLKKAFGTIDGFLRQPTTFNDDVLYELAFLEAVLKRGRAVTSADIALEWVGRILYTWGAERAAYQNLQRGLFPPESGRQQNPWAEWIGAQMRGTICGMVAPGDPAEAARLAFLDGQISAVNNAILGEVFNALLASLAFVERGIRPLLYQAASLIPPRSEYASVLAFALGQCEATGSWETAWEACRAKYRRYNWIHTYPNAAAEEVALYFCGDSFDTCMSIIALCGEDVDCNAGQIGTLFGLMYGYPALAPRWTEPFHDGFDSFFRGWEHTTVTHLAQETLRAAKQF